MVVTTKKRVVKENTLKRKAAKDKAIVIKEDLLDIEEVREDNDEDIEPILKK